MKRMNTLSLRKLNAVSGGLIVVDSNRRRLYIAEDETGRIFGVMNDLQRALHFAYDHKVSIRTMSLEEYNERFRNEFPSLPHR